MKKVVVNEYLTPKQKIQFESVSDQYVISYDDSELDAEILVGNYAPAKCKDYKNLELMLSTWAGYDAFIKKGVLPEKALFVNGYDCHTEEVAEHMFATLVSMDKNLHYYRDNQLDSIWHDEGGVKSIRDLRVLILGLGNIGKYLAKMCKDIGMYVIGIKRDISIKPEYVDELYTLDKIDELLPKADAVLNVLPSSAETKHLFTLERFKLMRSDALLINAGRGDLIDTDTLYEVLDKRIIRGIGQDVFEKEPILEDSKLWGLENLVITPHVAGFFHLDKDRQKWVDMCCENLRRYANGEELLHLVKERE